MSGELGPLVPALTQFGLAGILMAFLFFREKWDREDRKRREEADAEERKAQRELDEKDVESREKLASALAALSTIVQGLGGGRR